jgi:hypothetical protein
VHFGEGDGGTGMVPPERLERVRGFPLTPGSGCESCGGGDEVPDPRLRSLGIASTCRSDVHKQGSRKR